MGDTSFDNFWNHLSDLVTNHAFMATQPTAAQLQTLRDTVQTAFVATRNAGFSNNSLANLKLVVEGAVNQLEPEGGDPVEGREATDREFFELIPDMVVDTLHQSVNQSV